MEAGKGADGPAGRAGPLRLAWWAWRRRHRLAVALLALAVTLALWPWRTMAPPPPSPSSVDREWALRRCLGGVVTVGKGGRFGNVFMEWASAWAVARAHNLSLATPTALQRALRLAFSRVPAGPTVAALLEACPFADGLSEEDALRRPVPTRDVPEAAAAFAAAVANASAADDPAPGPLALSKYVVLPPFIARFAEELRAQVRWRAELTERAQATLRHVATLTAQRFGAAADEVVLVAVHARRTDYPAWMKLILHVQLEADADYYARALHRLARALEEDAEAEAGRAGAAGPIAAVVASDDMPWVRSVLLPALENMARTSALRLMAFAAGEGTEGSALQDLALLSACNHTVISYGTYGMTAALLAGGRVVAFQLHASYPTSQFAQLLPGWTLMRQTSDPSPFEENV